jgi:hypothetical protein
MFKLDENDREILLKEDMNIVLNFIKKHVVLLVVLIGLGPLHFINAGHINELRLSYNLEDKRIDEIQKGTNDFIDHIQLILSDISKDNAHRLA